MDSTNLSTADLADAHPAAQVASPGLRHFGGRGRFFGPIATILCFEDNSRVRELVASPGLGRVLVVDGGGSMQCALLGDLLGEKAVQNGWAGVVVNGCVRDSRRLRELPLGVMALETHPRRSEKRGLGEVDIPVRFAGVTFEPGGHLYADEDGLLVSAESLSLSN
ncbi:MAG: ribonuclease E activity regulator RraA [Steroidobacteraceae bacterium]